MKLRNVLMSAIVCMTTTLTALADYTPPSDDQMQAAAGAPAILDGLLKGASAEQAANVVKVVIARVAALHLSTADLGTRLSLIMSTTLKALPATGHIAFAEILGHAMGSDLVFKSQPDLVSATRAALVNAGGTTDGTALGLAFVAAVDNASPGSGKSKGSDKNTPPAGNLYRDQN